MADWTEDKIEELKPREWFMSGGNGVITIAEFGSTEPIAYLRPEQKANAGYIVKRHNAALHASAGKLRVELLDCVKRMEKLRELLKVSRLAQRAMARF